MPGSMFVLISFLIISFIFFKEMAVFRKECAPSDTGDGAFSSGIRETFRYAGVFTFIFQCVCIFMYRCVYKDIERLSVKQVCIHLYISVCEYTRADLFTKMYMCICL